MHFTDELHVNQEQANDKIRNKAKEIWKSGLNPFFVGGDHSITYPLFKNSDADGLIIFDAHADCVNNFSCVYTISIKIFENSQFEYRR